MRIVGKLFTTLLMTVGAGLFAFVIASSVGEVDLVLANAKARWIWLSIPFGFMFISISLLRIILDD